MHDESSIAPWACDLTCLRGHRNLHWYSPFLCVVSTLLLHNSLWDQAEEHTVARTTSTSLSTQDVEFVHRAQCWDWWQKATITGSLCQHDQVTKTELWPRGQKFYSWQPVIVSPVSRQTEDGRATDSCFALTRPRLISETAVCGSFHHLLEDWGRWSLVAANMTSVTLAVDQFLLTWSGWCRNPVITAISHSSINTKLISSSLHSLLT